MPDLCENNDKNIKVYPYFCKITSDDIQINKFHEIFKIDNSKNNVIEYVSGTYLVLVIDEIENGFMFGRFFKLRDDSPTIFDREKGKERDIPLLNGENVKEESHFVWNVADSIILAEFNFSAIRMFSYPLSYYLNEKFGVNDCRIEPLEDKNTFENLKMEDDILALNLRVAQESTKKLEEEYNLPAWKGLLEISKDNETIFEITVKRGRKKESKLDKDKVISIVGNLIENKAPIESVKVETQDIVYDLIKNNLLFYYIGIKKDGKKLNRHDFNNKVSLLYKKYSPNIKNNIKRD